MSKEKGVSLSFVLASFWSYTRASGAGEGPSTKPSSYNILQKHASFLKIYSIALFFHQVKMEARCGNPKKHKQSTRRNLLTFPYST